MNKPVLNEQQNRTLALLGNIYPEASTEEKNIILARMEGYRQAKSEFDLALEKMRKENENRNPA